MVAIHTGGEPVDVLCRDVSVGSREGSGIVQVRCVTPSTRLIIWTFGYRDGAIAQKWCTRHYEGTIQTFSDEQEGYRTAPHAVWTAATAAWCSANGEATPIMH